jgi:phosphoribosylanthranilate isomerase
MMVKVKICGLTNLADALVALTSGADYLGFILYPPSPRGITADELGVLLANLRAHPEATPILTRPNRPSLVGVFVNETAEHVAGLLDRLGLDLAQLSGNEDPSQLKDSTSPLHRRAYKTIRPKSSEDFEIEASRFLDSHDLIPEPTRPVLLIDTPHNTLYGGTGETGNWDRSAVLAVRVPGLMLAGGLNPDNVNDAVLRVNPFAVDTASGVEKYPGRKDYDLVRAFIKNAKHIST